MLSFDEFPGSVPAAHIAEYVEIVDAYLTMTAGEPGPALTSDDALWALLTDKRHTPELVDALIEVTARRRVQHRDVA